MPQSFQQKTPKGTPSNASNHISDPRFANMQTDPRFRLPSRKHTHVTLDKRFAHMLRDADFSGRAKVDRYGRRLPNGGGRKELERYYRIGGEDESEDDDEEQEEEKLDRQKRKAHGGIKSVGHRNGEEESGSSSSSDDNESLDEGEEEEEEEEVFGMLEGQEGGVDGIPRGEVSSRLAVVNLDWDNIRAADLMAVFSSFVPGSGRILNIAIYPSEFGRERLEREELEGPPKEIFGQKKENGVAKEDISSGEYEEEQDDEGDDDYDDYIKKSLLKEDPGNEFNSAKLRRYQLERLRYYYGVITCSSTSTAQAIYDAVDGTEYLTTANFFDLRYIPNTTDFSEDKPRDECERIPDGYRPNEFVTDALQHSKVRLTWDADDGGRKEAQKRAFAGSRADIDKNDLKAYLGSDSSEDEAPQPVVVHATNDTLQATADPPPPEEAAAPKLSKKERERQKMRALLGLSSEPAPKTSRANKEAPVVGDMQVTFSSGLTSDNKGSVFENTPEEAQETTVETYVRKEKERKARRKEKLKAARSVDDASAAKSQAEKDTQATSDADGAPAPDNDLGFDDPFFAAATADKETTTSKRKAERREKRQQREAEEAAAAAEEASSRAELELLMADDHEGGSNAGKKINHFNIDALARAERAASKSKKSHKSRKLLSQRDKEALEMKARDEFDMDVQDDRFRHVFERAEFAIDPSHPRYMGTQGMRRLLEEGRRKRANGEDEGVDGGGVGMSRKKVKTRGKEGEGDDVRQLVKRVKQKSIIA
ncbi:MAG: hypothetical protein Q9217_003761 [Psora testacea]